MRTATRFDLHNDIVYGDMNQLDKETNESHKNEADAYSLSDLDKLYVDMKELDS